jgi:hypothetical protein
MKKNFAWNIPISNHQNILLHCSGSPRGEETLCWEHPYQHSPEHSGTMQWLTHRRRNTLLGTPLSALTRTFRYIGDRGSPRGEETLCLEHPYQHSPEHSGTLQWLTQRRRNTLLGTSLSALTRTFRYIGVAHPEEKKHFSGNIPISTHQSIQVH